jgi:hypothetical protein
LQANQAPPQTLSGVKQQLKTTTAVTRSTDTAAEQVGMMMPAAKLMRMHTQAVFHTSWFALQ